MPALPVSVIICTCNRDDSLCDAISSVLQQDYEGGLELIVVDQSDGHTRRVANFIRSLEGRLRLLQQVQPNLPQARNAGSAAARNGLLIFVDDDMVLPRDAVARLASKVLPESRCAIAGLPVSDKAPEVSFKEYERLYGERIRDAASGLIEHPFYIPSPFCIPTQLYRALGGFDENLGRLSPPAYGEDDEFWQRAGRSGVRLFIDPGLRVTHRDHLAGGCGSRQTDPELALKYHMKSTAYIRMKHHGRLGAAGWVQLTRGYIANREILRNRPGHVVRNLMTARKAVGEVRAFMAGHSAGEELDRRLVMPAVRTR